jgi:hypothetical protein
MVISSGLRDSRHRRKASSQAKHMEDSTHHQEQILLWIKGHYTHGMGHLPQALVISR